MTSRDENNDVKVLVKESLREILVWGVNDSHHLLRNKKQKISYNSEGLSQIALVKLTIDIL